MYRKKGGNVIEIGALMYQWKAHKNKSNNVLMFNLRFWQTVIIVFKVVSASLKYELCHPNTVVFVVKNVCKDASRERMSKR